jgi:hypothetical protein
MCVSFRKNLAFADNAAEWKCLYTDNVLNENLSIHKTQNETVQYSENTQNTNIYISQEIWNQNWKYFRWLIRSLDVTKPV